MACMTRSTGEATYAAAIHPPPPLLYHQKDVSFPYLQALFGGEGWSGLEAVGWGLQ